MFSRTSDAGRTRNSSTYSELPEEDVVKQESNRGAVRNEALRKYITETRQILESKAILKRLSPTATRIAMLNMAMSIQMSDDFYQMLLANVGISLSPIELTSVQLENGKKFNQMDAENLVSQTQQVAAFEAIYQALWHGNTHHAKSANFIQELKVHGYSTFYNPAETWGGDKTYCYHHILNKKVKPSLLQGEESRSVQAWQLMLRLLKPGIVDGKMLPLTQQELLNEIKAILVEHDDALIAAQLNVYFAVYPESSAGIVASPARKLFAPVDDRPETPPVETAWLNNAAPLAIVNIVIEAIKIAIVDGAQKAKKLSDEQKDEFALWHNAVIPKIFTYLNKTPANLFAVGYYFSQKQINPDFTADMDLDMQLELALCDRPLQTQSVIAYLDNLWLAHGPGAHQVLLRDQLGLNDALPDVIRHSKANGARKEKMFSLKKASHQEPHIDNLLRAVIQLTAFCYTPLTVVALPEELSNQLTSGLIALTELKGDAECKAGLATLSEDLLIQLRLIAKSIADVTHLQGKPPVDAMKAGAATTTIRHEERIRQEARKLLDGPDQFGLDA